MAGYTAKTNECWRPSLSVRARPLGAAAICISVVIDRIIVKSEAMRSFWNSAHGWAPDGAAELLAKSRLDRQVSLSHTLKIWLPPSAPADHDGRLILAWVNLGCLVEGLLKFFLSVYRDDYRRAPIVGHKQRALDIERLELNHLLHFFAREVWLDEQRNQWEGWGRRVQQRRNAIHFYKDRDIGTFDEFFDDVKKYHDFLFEIDSQVPYP